MQIIFVVLLLTCAFQAIRAPRLLAAALWLAGASVFTSLLLFSMATHRIAVIELSVGGGLVTVLIVFAITMADEKANNSARIIPRELALPLAILPAALLGILLVFGPQDGIAVNNGTAVSPSRDLDLLLQALLIFAGGITVLHALPSIKVQPPAIPKTNQSESLTYEQQTSEKESV